MSLVETRSGLEFLIAQWLSAKKTKDTILFRGERRYLKSRAEIAKIFDHPTLVNDFVTALQLVYQFDTAVQNEAFNVAFGSAVRFGAILVEFGLFDVSGMPSGALMASVLSRKAASVKGGKATARFTADVRAKAEPIFRQCKRSNLSDESASKRTAAKLKAEHGIEISYRTIRRYLAKKRSDNA